MLQHLLWDLILQHIVGDKHAGLVDDGNVLHRNDWIMQDIYSCIALFVLISNSFFLKQMAWIKC